MLFTKSTVVNSWSITDNSEIETVNAYGYFETWVKINTDQTKEINTLIELARLSLFDRLM